LVRRWSVGSSPNEVPADPASEALIKKIRRETDSSDGGY